jgi:hypothetical protein
LVSRTRAAGHREVVIPDFMSGTSLEQVLSLVAGADETAAGHAVLREIRGPDLGPLSVVFRVFRPVQSDYGLGSDRPLLDGSSRPILAAEGLVIQRSARACEASGLTRADLEHAHITVVPAYQRFWHEENEYRTQTSRPIKVGASGTQLILHRAQPWDSPTPSPTPALASQRRPASGRSRKIRRAAAALAGLVLIAGGLSYYLSRQPRAVTGIGPLGADVTGCKDITHNQHQPGVMAALQCQPDGTAITVRIFRFDKAVRYQAAVAAQARNGSSTAPGTTCPPAPHRHSGAIAWEKPSQHLPAHPGQTLYCWQSATGQPLYLWIAPSINSYAEATAPTFTDLEHWWHRYNPAGVSLSATSTPP